MGRRKIEIQPITHERNRSVTFLKRKNGLFKKAYELGVLCSVDVAVIIFEDRPGHELKLHQYCSGDIRDIVQRQLRHQGDKDLRTPADFSGSAAKFDLDGEGDDDAVDEEEEEPVRPVSKRRGGKNSASAMASNDTSYRPSTRSMSRHAASGNSMGRFDEGGSGVGSIIPISNDRVSSLRDSTRGSSKRQRSAIDSMDPGRSRSPPGESKSSRQLPELYLPDQPPPTNRNFTRQLRGHNQDLAQYQHDGSGGHPSQNYNPNYTPMFPVANQASPPPSFIPLHTDFGPPRGHSSQGPPSSYHRGGGDMGAGPGFGQPPRTRYEPQYDPALYAPPIRQQSSPFGSQQGPGPHRGEDFGVFLEADQRLGRQQQQQQSAIGHSRSGSANMDWPSHEGTPPTHSDMGSRGMMDAPPNSGGPGISMAANGTSTWFDLFSNSASGAHSGSGNGQSNSNQGKKSPLQGPGTSWERGGTSSRDDLATIFGSSNIIKADRSAASAEAGPASDDNARVRAASRDRTGPTEDVEMRGPPSESAGQDKDDGGARAASVSGGNAEDKKEGQAATGNDDEDADADADADAEADSE